MRIDPLNSQAAFQFVRQCVVGIALALMLGCQPAAEPLRISATSASHVASVPRYTAAPSDSANLIFSGDGAARASWSATARHPWLTLTTSSGTGSGRVRWIRDASALAPAIYVDTITVSAAGAIQGSPVVIYDTLIVMSALPPTGPFSIDHEAWASGTVTLRSPDFRLRGSAAVLLIGTDTAALSRVDDSMLTARIPTTTPGGTVTPAFSVDGYPVPLGNMTIYGYADAQILPLLAGEGLAWPRVGNASLMTPTSNGLSLFDLGARTVTSFNGVGTLNAGDCMNSPGPTYMDSVFTVCGSGGVLETWRLFPTPTRLAVTPYSLA
jgi:hypothetical protein